MPHIKRLPLPEPFTVDAAVRHLYLAYSNRGAVQLSRINLANPRMVDALSSLWQAEHAWRQGASEHEEEIAGFLPGNGRWRLTRSRDGSGSLAIEADNEAGKARSPL